MWELGIEPRSSARAARAFNHRAISPTPSPFACFGFRIFVCGVFCLLVCLFVFSGLVVLFVCAALVYETKFHTVAQAGLELMILLHWPLEYCYRCEPPHLAFLFLNQQALGTQVYQKI